MTPASASGNLCSNPFDSTSHSRRISLMGLTHACGLLVLAALVVAPLAARAQVQVVPSIATITGNGTQGYSGDGGSATNAEINLPYAVAVDKAGNVYFADGNNNRIREILAATGIITTIAGNGTAGYSGDGGPAIDAELSVPQGVTLDGAGNVYFADEGNSRIREIITATGTIETIAGSSTRGFSGDGGPATSAELKSPIGVAVDSAGNVYIADTYNNRIREVVASTGIIETIAGDGTPSYYGDGGSATTAELDYPSGLAVDSAGNVYIADNHNNRIREVVASTGVIETIAGNGTAGFSGDGGPADNAEFYYPSGLAVDSAGNVYIADDNNQRIREVAVATGNIETVAGNGTPGYSGDGGTAPGAELNGPVGVAVDSAGNLYIADLSNQRIREVSTFTSFPATAIGSSSATQNINIELVSAQPVSSISAAVSQGNKQEFVVGAVSGCAVDGTTVNAAGSFCTVPITFKPAWPGMRSMPLTVQAGSGTITTGLTGTGAGPLAAFTPGIINTLAGSGQGLSGYGGDGGPATSAQLASPYGLGVDGGGNVYIADSLNDRVREVVAATRVIETIAGNGAGGYSGDGGPATGAKLSSPYSVAVDGAGNLYIADTGNHRIREVVAATGIIETIAGNGTAGFSGDGGPATSAELYFPYGVAVDRAGNVYIADTGNNVIREVVAETGTMETIAGNGTPGYSGDGGLAASAELNSPWGLAVDGAGNVYIADILNNRVREVVAAAGVIETIAGDGTAGSGGDGGPAVSAELWHPTGVAVDGAGNVYIAGNADCRIREVVAATGSIETIAGTVTGGFSGDGGPATSAEFSDPVGMALDGAGNVYASDAGNQRIRSINVTESSATFATTAAGSTSTDSPQTVTVENIGNADLIITGVAYPTDFPEDGTGPGDCTSTTSLSPAGTCTLTIDFSPLASSLISSSTSLSESISVTDNSLNSGAAVQSLNVSGTATTTQAMLTSPAANSVLAGPSVTFSWIAATGATSYHLWLGTTLGGHDLYASGPISATSATDSHLPTNGETIYARLYTTYGSSQAYSDYVFTAFTQPTLTVTANDLSRLYGTANPTLTYTITGFVNGDTQSVVSGAPSLTSTATTSSPAGTYTIVAALGTLTAPSYYAFAFVNGTLTVTPPPPTATLSATSLNFNYVNQQTTSAAQGFSVTNKSGSALTISSISITGTNAISFAISYNTCGTSLAAGASCNIAATFTPGSEGSYQASISISDDAADSPQTVQLSGTGVIPPAVTTLAATGVTSSSSTLEGTVNPENQGTVFYFCYTTNPAINILDGTKTSTQRISAGAGSIAQEVFAAISGLTANTTYYYAIVATGPGGGYNVGATLSFTTP